MQPPLKRARTEEPTARSTSQLSSNKGTIGAWLGPALLRRLPLNCRDVYLLSATSTFFRQTLQENREVRIRLNKILSLQNSAEDPVKLYELGESQQAQVNQILQAIEASFQYIALIKQQLDAYHASRYRQWPPLNSHATVCYKNLEKIFEAVPVNYLSNSVLEVLKAYASFLNQYIVLQDAHSDLDYDEEFLEWEPLNDIAINELGKAQQAMGEPLWQWYCKSDETLPKWFSTLQSELGCKKFLITWKHNPSWIGTDELYPYNIHTNHDVLSIKSRLNVRELDLSFYIRIVSDNGLALANCVRQSLCDAFGVSVESQAQQLDSLTHLGAVQSF